MRRRPSKEMGPAIFLLVVLGISLLSWPLSFGPLLRLAGTATWEPSRCTILQREESDNQGSSGSRRFSILRMQYAYEVDGHGYTGTAINASQLDGGTALQDGDSPVRAYAVGETHPCWVNPLPPHDAVLERQVTVVPWFVGGVLSLLLFGALVTLIGDMGAQSRQKAGSASRKRKRRGRDVDP